MSTTRRSFLKALTVAAPLLAVFGLAPRRELVVYRVTGGDDWTNGMPNLRKGDTFTISGMYR